MAPIKVEEADEATIARFQLGYVNFLRQFDNFNVSQIQNGTQVPDGHVEDQVSDKRKQEAENDIAEIYDLGARPHLRLRRVIKQLSTAENVLRNPSLASTIAIDRYNAYRIGIVVFPGDLLEIHPHPGVLYNCRFFRVEEILKPGNGPITFRGIPYTRTRNTLAMLEYQRNELVEIWDVNDNDNRPAKVQAQLEIFEDDVVRKRSFIVTNAQWPEFGCNKADYSGDAKRTDNEGHLACRWRMLTEYRNHAEKQKRRAYSRQLYHLSETDIKEDSLYRVSDKVKLYKWRGTKTPGGSYHPNRSDHGAINIDENEKTFVTDKHQKYTFGDIFCGAGGASRGADTAGFQVSFACDLDRASCESYRMNFPDADLKEANISDVLSGLKVPDMRLDILHLSPPCQYWSPAHTRPGKDDEANQVILMAAKDIINKFRPRIATVEQTFGILAARHMQLFHLLLNCFTSNGYSVTWEYVHLQNWGVPQPRKRVVIIASCPGESHPLMPSSIEGPLPTINSALAQIHPGATHHSPERLLNHPNYPKPPYNGDTIARHTMTTVPSGQYNYHPSGLRPLTTREFAMLQTFPSKHRFVSVDTHAKKQIGNAFPPRAVEWLYKHILGHLKEKDRFICPNEILPNEASMVVVEEERDDVVFLGSRSL